MLSTHTHTHTHTPPCMQTDGGMSDSMAVGVVGQGGAEGAAGSEVAPVLKRETAGQATDKKAFRCRFGLCGERLGGNGLFRS